MKKQFAIFTIVKNEKFFIPIWIKYYSQFFDYSDMYILDHMSDDYSTCDLPVNVEKVNNPLVFDHQWLIDTVKAKQIELLKSYECVIYTDVDEILFSIDCEFNTYLDNFLNSRKEYVTAVGYELIQNLEIEQAISIGDTIKDKRSYWFRYGLYDKTLISRIPLDWNWGYHSVKNLFSQIDSSLICLHLHRVDLEQMIDRHLRYNFYTNKGDTGASDQYKLKTRDEVIQYFKRVPGLVQEIDKELLKYLNI